MANGSKRIAELLTAPMAEVIISLGQSIAAAQKALDQNSIETQRQINEDPVLADLGLQAPWYQMPRVELELTMAVALEEKTPQTTPSAALTPNISALTRLRQIHFQPVNALYSNQFNYSANASSKLKLTIVPVPPPANEAAIPRLSTDEVTSIASPHLLNDATARLALNFNGQGRLWFVLQYRLQNNVSTRLVLVVVDDETRQIVKVETTAS